MLGAYPVDQCGHLRFVAHVGLFGLSGAACRLDVGDHLLARISIAVVVHDHVVPALCQATRDRRPDTAARSADQCHCARHQVLLVCHRGLTLTTRLTSGKDLPLRKLQTWKKMSRPSDFRATGTVICSTANARAGSSSTASPAAGRRWSWSSWPKVRCGSLSC